MKKLVSFVTLIILIAILSTAHAEYINTDELNTALSGEAKQHLGDISPIGGDVKSGALNLAESALALFRDKLKDAMSIGFFTLALCMLISIATSFAKSSGLQVPEKIVDITAVCGILIICFSASSSLINECSRAIVDLNIFSNILIPAFGVATAVAGRPVTAAASAGTVLIFTKVIITLAQTVFIPSLYLYIVTVAAGAMSDSPLLSKVAHFIKWLSTIFFRGFLMVFTGYLSLSGLVSGKADAAAVKTAQVTISGVLPVVGGIISGISDTILAGASLLRSGIGVFGFLGACAICLSPFVKVLAHMMVFKLLSAFSGAFAHGGAAKILDGIASAYSIALGILGTCCAVQFISIVVSMVVTNA